MVLLDRFMPDCDIGERHALVIAAAPERVLAATRELRSKELPLFVVLMGLRGLPGLVRGRSVLRLDRPLLDELVRLGFVRLGESPHELVLGISGRFWRLDGGLRRVPAAEFASFAEPGWVQAAVDFHVEDHPDGTLLSTETRVAATDEHARRRFGRYWRVIRVGSVAIRWAWLRAIRRRALR
jgi:hypothetical protein